MSFQFLTGGRLTQVDICPPNLKTLATPMPLVYGRLSPVIQFSVHILHCPGRSRIRKVVR